MSLFETRTSRRDQINWTTVPLNPKSDLGIIIPDADTYSMHGGFGKIDFQGLASEDEYTIWASHYGMKRTTSFISESSSTAFELNILLKNSVEHTLFDHIHQSIAAQQYNLFFLPYIKNEIVLFKDQNYETLDFHFELGYFEKLLPQYPNIIGPMLDQAYNGRGVSFLPVANFLNEDQRFMGRHIIRLISKKLSDKYYLNIAVKFLLISILLNRLPHGKNRIMSLEEETNIIESHQKLMEDLSEFVTVKELAKTAKMNTTKFMRLFKVKYDATPHDFWNEFRMDKALEMLLTTDKTITEISNTLGFYTIRGFEKAIYERYSLPPTKLRKRMRG